MFGRRPRGKYGAQKINHAGRSFASKLEADVFDLLSIMEAHGEIRDLKCQVTVYLTDARIQYRPDFQFFDVTLGEIVFAEAKGFETPEWRIKRRLWLAGYGPGRLRVFKSGGRRGPVLFEELRPSCKTLDGVK